MTRINTGQSLYQRSPEKWDRMAGMGFPSLAAAAKTFYTLESMAKAIGTSTTSISRWMNGDDEMPRRSFEIGATNWLRTLTVQPPATPKAQKPQPQPDLFTSSASRDEDGVMLWVSCGDKALAEKAQRLLARMGCEVEVI